MLKGWKERTIGVESCAPFIYPYGPNDNVRKVGNISKCKDGIVVNTLFHKQTRNFRKRQPRKRRRKIEVSNLTESLEKLLDNYKSCHFCFSIRSLILSLPRKCMITLWSIVNN